MASRSLGTLTLDLIARVGGFVQGMNRAERSANRSARNTENSWKSASSAIKTAFGAIAVGATAKAIVDATVKQEAAVKQLEARLKSTGGVAGFTSQELQTMASSMQNLTTFGDEAVIEMQSLLLTFTNIRGEIFERATPAILDMATAMGTDLKGASIQLGKALNDPVKGVGALADAGVQFTEKQQATIKALVDTGNTAKAQEIILAELETQFGGAAAAAADTFGGALQQVQNAFGDLLEADGGLDDAKEGLQDLRDLLSDPKTVQAAKTLTGALITGFANVTTAITNTVNTFQFLGEELAATISGPAADDIARLEAEIEEGMKLLESGPLSRLRFFGNDGVVEFYNDEEIKQRLSQLQTLVDDFYKRNTRKPPPLLPLKEDTNQTKVNTEEIIKNEKARKERETQAKKNAADLAKNLDQLREQAALLGKTTEQQQLYKIELLGASDAQLAEARALQEKIKAFEDAQQAQDDYKSLLSELQTDEEKLTEQLQKRLDTLAAIEGITDAQRQQTQSRIASAQFEDAPELGGVDLGIQSQVDQLNDAQAELDEWYTTSLERLNQYRVDHADLNAEWNEQELELQREYQENLDDINAARRQAQLAGAQDLFSELSSLAGEYAGKSSDLYRALFAVEKGVAIARSIVAINTAIAQASASAPFPANLGAMASVAAATAGLISNIRSAVVGQAHDGIDSVPTTGTWLLERGERVTTAETSAKLDATLDEVKQSNDEQKTMASASNISVFAVLDENTIYDLMQTSRAEEIVIRHFERNRNVISGAAQ